MARRLAVAATVGWGLGSLSADAELVVSELVTNAVRAKPKRVVFAEGEEDCVIRAAAAFQNSGMGKALLVGRPEVVSTPRADVHVVVTEHGVADLRGLDDVGRRAALIAVADPAHREALDRSLI